MKIGSFTAASNVTGILSDTNTISSILHQYSALSFWDYATAAPYVKVDMNPYITGPQKDLVHKDAIFISGHKFPGGLGSPGIIIAKKFLFDKNRSPPRPGGGTVFFV